MIHPSMVHPSIVPDVHGTKYQSGNREESSEKSFSHKFKVGKFGARQFQKRRTKKNSCWTKLVLETC